MTEPSQTGTIVVSGTGRVAVDPDLAELRLGVAISRETVAEARSEAAATMAAILAAVRGTGVAERDIRTSMVSVQPRYDYRDGKAPALVGYDLANIVEVTVASSPRWATSSTARSGRARPASTGSSSGSRTRRPRGRRPDRGGRRCPGQGRRARRRRGLRVAGVADIVEGGAPPAFPLAKAARMSLAADSGTPVAAGTTEIAVTVTVTFRVVAG